MAFQKKVSRPLTPSLLAYGHQQNVFSEVADSLKSAMWTCSSGVNMRKVCSHFVSTTTRFPFKPVLRCQFCVNWNASKALLTLVLNDQPWTKFEGRTPEEAMKSLPLDVQQQLGLWKHFAPVVQRVVVNILKGRIQDVP